MNRGAASRPALRQWEDSPKWHDEWKKYAERLTGLPRGLLDELYVEAANTFHSPSTNGDWGKTKWVDFVKSLYLLCGVPRPANQAKVVGELWKHRQGLVEDGKGELYFRRARLMVATVRIVSRGQSRADEWTAFAEKLTQIRFEETLSSPEDAKFKPPPDVLYDWARRRWAASDESLDRLEVWVKFLSDGDRGKVSGQNLGVYSKHCARLCGRVQPDFSLFDKRVFGGEMPEQYCCLTIFSPKVGRDTPSSASLVNRLASAVEKLAYPQPPAESPDNVTPMPDESNSKMIRRWFEPTDAKKNLRARQGLAALLVETFLHGNSGNTQDSAKSLVDELVKMLYPNQLSDSEFRRYVKDYLVALYRDVGKSMNFWERTHRKKVESLTGQLMDNSV